MTMDWKAQNIKIYDDSAQELANHFNSTGVRVDDIELGLKLAGADKSSTVIEIGCGDGRDAQEIVKRVGQYEGFDPSKGLLEIAKKNLPNTSFVVADALSYNYHQNVDVIFAFASLLHVNKTDLAIVFKKVAKSLRAGGVFYISLKERQAYSEEIKKDQYGERMFYYYNVELIKKIAANLFMIVHEVHYSMNKTDWFTVALKKPIK